MRLRSKLLLTATAAALAFAFAVGTASANQLSVNSDEFYLIWEDGSERLNLVAGGVAVECEVTLLGSFHERTIDKETELIGYVTHASVDSAGCNGGVATVKGGLPWHVTFEGYTGTLPEITGVRLLLTRIQFLIEVDLFGGLIQADCLSISDPGVDPAGGLARLDGSGNVTSVSADSSYAISLDDLPEGETTLCDEFGTGSFEGTAAASTEEGGSGTLVIDLI